MELEEANKIVNAWGIHLEYFQGKLTFLFGGNIPESLLPFPIETLEEALNIMAEYHHNNGNEEGCNVMKGGFGWLTAYKNDEEAILQATKNFDNPKWREAMLPALKQFQKKWASEKNRLPS